MVKQIKRAGADIKDAAVLWLVPHVMKLLLAAVVASMSFVGCVGQKVYNLGTGILEEQERTNDELESFEEIVVINSLRVSELDGAPAVLPLEMHDEGALKAILERARKRHEVMVEKVNISNKGEK